MAKYKYEIIDSLHREVQEYMDTKKDWAWKEAIVGEWFQQITFVETAEVIEVLRGSLDDLLREPLSELEWDLIPFYTHQIFFLLSELDNRALTKEKISSLEEISSKLFR